MKGIIIMNKLDGWDDDQMREQRFALVSGYDISHLDPTSWNADQMEQERTALEGGTL